MVSKKLDSDNFIKDHFIGDVRLPVQCFFLYKVDQEDIPISYSKSNAEYNCRSYQLEAFYKCIHIPCNTSKLI